MKRSTINYAIQEALACFHTHHWKLPPNPKWDVTDFGLGEFSAFGLVLVNLAEEPEYCEKLMYARKHQKTPAHMHKKKKEDIIVRAGRLAIQIWAGEDGHMHEPTVTIKKNGTPTAVHHGDAVLLEAGERITLTPGIYHEFWPESEQCIIGEVSTANDDLNDNFFVNPKVGRFSQIEEDVPRWVKLVSDS
ncbi:MAG: D-lyxose/D-mannose family sugar isomerase [Bacteroidota bacterium]